MGQKGLYIFKDCMRTCLGLETKSFRLTGCLRLASLDLGLECKDLSGTYKTTFPSSADQPLNPSALKKKLYQALLFHYFALTLTFIKMVSNLYYE